MIQINVTIDLKVLSLFMSHPFKTQAIQDTCLEHMLCVVCITICFMVFARWPMRDQHSAV